LFSDEAHGFVIIGLGGSIITLIPLIFLTKSGYGRMTILSCFSGEMFNLVISLGIGMVYMTYNGSDVTSIGTMNFDEEKPYLLVVITLFLFIHTLAISIYN
jgi:Ca2+/Na+ antiporter